MMSLSDLHEFKQQYLNLIQLEINAFNVKPTELRHLIGRLGEFECALRVNGQLSRTPNQPGFDVIDQNGRKISVKTTAQTGNFISISPGSYKKADDLMVIQFSAGTLDVLYYGAMELAISYCRLNQKSNMYEFDLSKAKRLNIVTKN